MLNPERCHAEFISASLQGRLGSASNKINDLRDPEIVDPEINSGPGSG